MLHYDVSPVHLPLIGFWAESEQSRFIPLRSRVEKLGDETVRVDGVMVDQLRKGGKPGFSGDKKMVVFMSLLDPVVVDASLVSEGDRSL